jgi:hypothetical protein
VPWGVEFAAEVEIAAEVLDSAAVAEGCGSDPGPDARRRRGFAGGAGAGGVVGLLSSGCDREFFLAMAFLNTQITTLVHARRRKNRRTEMVLRRHDVVLQTIRQRKGISAAPLPQQFQDPGQRNADPIRPVVQLVLELVHGLIEHERTE